MKEIFGAPELALPLLASRPVTASTQPADPARRPLYVVAVMAFIATVTGTFIYAYPNTLQSVRSAMIVVHDLSGDLLVVAGVWYLWIHLARTWRMKKRHLSRWSGYVAVLLWIVAAATGVFGQLVAMPSGSTPSTLHAISGIALLVLGCFHGAYGLRRYFR